MPRYHFNVYDRNNFQDDDDLEMSSVGKARNEAIRYAGEFLASTASHVVLGKDWRMEITDERGLVLFRLNFSIIEMAAVSGERI